MKKHRIFNPRLYFHGLKSTSIIGVCCMALICLIYTQNDRPNILDNFVTSEMYYSEPDHIITIAILFFVPVFIFAVFSFLRSRAATDFVQSLPETRLCTLTSYFSAAISWPVIIYFLYYLFIFLLIICCGKTPTFTGFFEPMLSFFSNLLLLSGLSLFAVSITGTLFTGICVFICSALVPIASAIYLFSVIGYTPITDFIVLDYSTLNELWTFVVSKNFLLLSGITLIVVSTFLYVKRKSELSGKTSVTKRSHVILSLFITYPVMCFLSIIVSILFFNKQKVGTDIKQTAFFLIAPLFAALLIWFIFNLIIKKSLSGALVSLRWSALMLAVPILLFSLIMACGSSILAVSPDSSEVESISVEIDANGLPYDTRTRLIFYKRLEGITFTDEESKKIFCDTLKFKIANSTEDWVLSIDADDYESDIFSRESTNDLKHQSGITVKYKLKNGMTVTRINCFTELTFKGLCGIEEFAEKLLYIDPNSVTDYYYTVPTATDMIRDPEDNTARLFIEEYNNASVEERLKSLFSGFKQVTISLNGDNIFEAPLTFSVPSSFTNTCNKIYELSVASGVLSPAEEIIPLLTEINGLEITTDDYNTRFYGYLYYNGEEYYLPDIPTYKQHPDYTSFAKNCISLILSDPLINSEADPNGIHVIVRCSSVERDDGSHDSCSAFLKVSEETALSLIEQINALKEAKSNPQVQYQY